MVGRRSEFWFTTFTSTGGENRSWQTNFYPQQKISCKSWKRWKTVFHANRAWCGMFQIELQRDFRGSQSAPKCHWVVFWAKSPQKTTKSLLTLSQTNIGSNMFDWLQADISVESVWYLTVELNIELAMGFSLLARATLPELFDAFQSQIFKCRKLKWAKP